MNVILGSGIIGLLAKKILGDDWMLLPFKKSRYFYFDIPFADNFIKYSDKIDNFIKPMIVQQSPMIMYKSPFSYKGQLISGKDAVSDLYLEKIYGNDIPHAASSLLNPSFMVYPITVKQLYEALQRKYINEIKKNTSKYGKVIDIDTHNREIKLSISNINYSKMISTIPLNALCDYVGVETTLPSSPIYYYIIRTDNIDLEGAQQSFVCDLEIPFFKVVALNNGLYVFWSKDNIDEPYDLFGSILGYNFDIVEVRFIEEALPLGQVPRLDFDDILCVGSNAQWDDFMDVSSCINRLLNYNGSM